MQVPKYAIRSNIITQFFLDGIFISNSVKDVVMFARPFFSMIFYYHSFKTRLSITLGKCSCSNFCTFVAISTAESVGKTSNCA